MKVFEKLISGLKKTKERLTHELRRILSGSPRLSPESIEELEAVLLGADFGVTLTERIIKAVREAYETQGKRGAEVVAIAREQIIRALCMADRSLRLNSQGPTVISLVGVNGTGKTTTAAKLAYWFREKGKSVLLAACDTFRAAAVEQLVHWGERLKVPVICGQYGADPAAVAHDALTAAVARGIDVVIVDTAGRLHTKRNLMSELQKVHRVMSKKIEGAPHEVLLVIDAHTGTNAFAQAKVFRDEVGLTGIVVTKLDGTSKAGMAAAVQIELGIPIKFVGLGEDVEDLEVFDPEAYAAALFEVTEERPAQVSG